MLLRGFVKRRICLLSAAPEPPKEAQERPKRRPGQPKRESHPETQDGPGTSLEPGAAQERPKGPGGAQEGPERLPGCENLRFLLGFRASKPQE